MIGIVTLATGQRRKSSLSNQSLLQRATKAETQEIISKRLLRAREINGYSQTDAAKRFGYATPAQLSQWEMNRRMPPLQMLIRASAIYRVSMDFLMGVSEEPDRDPQSVIRAQVLDGAEELMRASTDAIAELIIQQIATGGPTLEMSVSMAEEGERFHTAVTRFMVRNKVAFEDMPGGAPLQGMAERFEMNCLRPARAQLDRHRRLKPAEVERMRKRFRPKAPGITDMFDPDVSQA